MKGRTLPSTIWPYRQQSPQREILCEIDADNIVFRFGKLLDDVPHAIWAAVIHQHNLITVAWTFGGHFALNFFDHRDDGIFGTVTRNYKLEFRHNETSDILKYTSFLRVRQNFPMTILVGTDTTKQTQFLEFL